MRLRAHKAHEANRIARQLRAWRKEGADLSESLAEAAHGAPV
jgi:hypothetical protein